MLSRRFAALLLALGASSSGIAGVITGNPDNLTTSFQGHGVTVDSADIVTATLEVEDCSTNLLASYGPQSFDLTTSPAVELPPGTCVVRLAHAGTVTVEGSDGGTGTFTLDLDLPSFELTFSGAVPQGTDRYVLALTAPGWTTATELGLASGTHVSVDDQDAVHDTIVGRITANAAVFVDSDSDGLIDSTERAAGAVAW